MISFSGLVVATKGIPNWDQLGSACHLLQVPVAKAVPLQVRSRNWYQESCVVVAPELSKESRSGFFPDTDGHSIDLIMVN